MALGGVNDNDSLITRILDRRMAFLKALKTWKTFSKGWTARVNGVRAVGQAWATGSDATTRGGIGSGTLAGTLQQAQDQLTPLSTSSDFVGKLVAGLIIARAVLTLGGVAYRWYAKRKKDEMNDALDLQGAH